MFSPPTLATQKVPEGQDGCRIFGILIVPWGCGNAGRAASGSQRPAHPLAPSTLGFFLHNDGPVWAPSPNACPLCACTPAHTRPLCCPAELGLCGSLHGWTNPRGHSMTLDTDSKPSGLDISSSQDLQHSPEVGYFSVPQTFCPRRGCGGHGQDSTSPALLRRLLLMDGPKSR